MSPMSLWIPLLIVVVISKETVSVFMVSARQKYDGKGNMCVCVCVYIIPRPSLLENVNVHRSQTLRLERIKVIKKVVGGS